MNNAGYTLEPLFAIPQIGEEERLAFLYDRLAACFGFGPAIVRLSRRKLTGGEICYGNPHSITISAHLSAAEREDTLRHEAAHAWAFQVRGARVAHGALFRELARRLGARAGHAPETRALKEFREKREIAYHCAGCGHLFRRFRPFRGTRHCVPCWNAGRDSRLSRVQGSGPRVPG